MNTKKQNLTVRILFPNIASKIERIIRMILDIIVISISMTIGGTEYSETQKVNLFFFVIFIISCALFSRNFTKFLKKQ